jgi:hypothetical protein
MDNDQTGGSRTPTARATSKTQSFEHATGTAVAESRSAHHRAGRRIGLVVHNNSSANR